MSNNITFQLSKKIYHLARGKKLTVKHLANLAGVSKAVIYNVMHSGTKAYNPKIGTVQKLAHAFKVPMTEFFDFSQSRKQHGTTNITL